MAFVEIAPAPQRRLQTNQPITGYRHRWRAQRTSHAVRCQIVEPARYDPPSHATLFGKLVQAMAAPIVTGLDENESGIGISPFDLLTLPEAFLPADALLDGLRFLSGQKVRGAVHVGLRPDAGEVWLFTPAQALALVGEMRRIPRVEQGDLDPFSIWMASEPAQNHYNLACVFMLDEDGQIRICLHPKNVASNVEVSILPEQNVAEAEYVAIVTIESVDPVFQDLNVQPLICSDALDLRTPRPGPNPVSTVTTAPERIIPNAPEHVDIVSIVTCTPQRDQERERLQGGQSLAWQPKFRATFAAASINDAYARHVHATFVMSNFHIGPEGVPGGLSGGFMPCPPVSERQRVEGVKCWLWGREGPGDPAWRPLDSARIEDWKSDGHIAALDPLRYDKPEIARVFGFTIPLMLRNQPRLAPAVGLTNFVVKAIYPLPAEAEVMPETLND